MKSIFQKESFDEIISRINKLTPTTQRQWGKMNVDQMLAHCTIGLETAIGTKVLSQLLIGKLIGRFFKSMIINEKHFRRNSKTHPGFIIPDKRDFEREKEQLIKLAKQFSEGGEGKCTSNPHSFFGKLTPNEWGVLMYKHIDHHLQQFDV